MSSLRDRLEDVRLRVEMAAERSRRLPSDVQIVAVSKTVGTEVIVEAYHLGQWEFGENRVQEFSKKRAVLDAAGISVRWHMLGHLQSNKAAAAVELFDIIQSVGSVGLAQILDRRAEELRTRIPVLLQVDFSANPRRSGFEPDELDAGAPILVEMGGLDIQGLMTVAPLGLDANGLRGIFRRLRAQRDRLAARHPGVEWRHLSMGMSNDFELAIEEGATMVRIGRAIFGERPQL
jgi:PLP dependent protein